MKKGTQMQDRIKEYNTLQLEERVGLPNLIEMIKEAQEGNLEYFNQYFYGFKMIERFPYEGKMQSYEVNKIKFWDRPLDIFITNMKKKYTKDVAVGEMGGFEGRKVSFKVNVSNFEESEIDALWFEWMLGFIQKIELEKFDKGSESKTLNAIRKYIRTGFESHLKRVDNEKIGLERVIVDGNLYYVKSKQEEVFFDDIYVGKDEDGENINFLDIVGTRDTSGFDVSDLMATSKKFIEENLEDTLTNKQLEKWNMLTAHVNEFGIESLLDKHTGKLVKAKLQRVVYPEKNFKNNERADIFIDNVNKRMEKALDQAGLEYVSLAEQNAKENPNKENMNSEVEVFTGGFTEEEVARYFQEHLEFIFRAYVEGRLTFDKGTNGMLPSLENMEEIPFDVWERWLAGGKATKMEIIKEYHNKDKFKMKAGAKVVKKITIVAEEEDKNNRYINADMLKEIRKNAGK